MLLISSDLQIKKIIHGVNGIEKSFNDLLKGEEGVRLVERNAVGDVMTFSEDETREAVPGDNIYLTIKRSFQSVLEEELQKGISDFDASSGVGIIMNPNTRGDTGTG